MGAQETVSEQIAIYLARGLQHLSRCGADLPEWQLECNVGAESVEAKRLAKRRSRST